MKEDGKQSMAIARRKKKSVLGLMSTCAGLGVSVSGSCVSAAWRERCCPRHSTTQRYTHATRMTRSMVPIVANTTENCLVLYDTEDADAPICPALSFSISPSVRLDERRWMEKKEQTKKKKFNATNKQKTLEKEKLTKNPAFFSPFSLFFFLFFFKKQQTGKKEGCLEEQQ